MGSSVLCVTGVRRCSPEFAISAIVRMTKPSSASGHSDGFACSVDAWRLLQELATSYGWEPLGTTYVSSARGAVDLARHNYEPGNRNDLKCVECQDAHDWANALRAARESSEAALLIERGTAQAVSSQLSAADTLSGSAPFVAVLHEFIEYARSGAFNFGPGNSELR